MKHEESSPLLGFRSVDNTIDDDDDDDKKVLRLWIFSRWQSLSSVCMYVSVAGTTYAFGIYSSLLKSRLGYSQESLDIIASVGNTGLYLSILSGLLLEMFGLRVSSSLSSSLSSSSSLLSSLS